MAKEAEPLLEDTGWLPDSAAHSGRFSLRANETVAVWSDTRGPAAIRALEFSIPRDRALAFSKVRLRVTWTAARRHPIDAPIALFYGAGVLYNRDNREYLVKSFPMVIRYAADRVYLSCYFPMP